MPSVSRSAEIRGVLENAVEFEATVDRLFAQADVDGNGVVDRGEFRALLEGFYEHTKIGGGHVPSDEVMHASCVCVHVHVLSFSRLLCEDDDANVGEKSCPQSSMRLMLIMMAPSVDLKSGTRAHVFAVVSKSFFSTSLLCLRFAVH